MENKTPTWLKPLPLPVGSWILKHNLSESEKLVPPIMSPNGMYYHYQQVVAMMKEYSDEQEIELKAEFNELLRCHNETVHSFTESGHKLMDQLDAKDTELTRLRTLIKQVFDLQYDHLSWCEFEKQVLIILPLNNPS